MKTKCVDLFVSISVVLSQSFTPSDVSIYKTKRLLSLFFVRWCRTFFRLWRELKRSIIPSESVLRGRGRGGGGERKNNKDVNPNISAFHSVVFREKNSCSRKGWKCLDRIEPWTVIYIFFIWSDRLSQLGDLLDSVVEEFKTTHLVPVRPSVKLMPIPKLWGKIGVLAPSLPPPPLKSCESFVCCLLSIWLVELRRDIGW